MDVYVERATSENLTAEDWSMIIGICEQVEGSSNKAEEAVVALSKRLGHKNVNVILYSLTLANALVQNCGMVLRREVSSRAFLQTLIKLLSNTKTHVIVKNRILDLIQSWAEEFKGKGELDYMGEVYRDLLSEGYKFPSSENNPPTPKKTAYSSKEKEEEDLQMAIAMSLSEAKNTTTRAESLRSDSIHQSFSVLFQVCAMYNFNATEEGELPITKGQIIDVLDNSTFSDWWKGTVDGKVGIFPANYVSQVETSSKALIQRPVPDENAIILQNWDTVKNLKLAIQKADPLGHNSKENESLQREYQKVVELVPLVLQRANGQRQKQDDLAGLHGRFSTAVATYQGIMNSYSVQRQQQFYQQ